ncbi:MAG: aminotransferase class IV [Flavobacteriales bacterium]|nr:aminotransferase class IV [Flavobacteriales bacterium]|tara:strand:- start:15829 stop:16665 length:837 start_codon:yes stop_codon:yes gene_type:complete
MDNVYFNGTFCKKSKFSILYSNRAFQYGDAFFDTIRCHKGSPLFWEAHYFRIAASFYIMKMSPPDDFEMKKLKSIVKNLLLKNNLASSSSRVKITFFRNSGGYYSPKDHSVSVLIESEKIADTLYKLNKSGLRVGSYKDNFISKHSLSNIKTTNKALNVLASIYAQDNGFDDCLLLNNEKNIVESTSGNIFIVSDDNIKTPLLSEGCIDGIIRKVLLNEHEFNIKEEIITFLDILNAQEVFFTNVIQGVSWVSSIKNTDFVNYKSTEILDFLNKKYFV